jgi:hypothetical protein
MERSHEYGHDQHAPSQSGGDAESVPGGVLISARGFTLEPLRTRFEAGVRSRFEFRIRDYAGDIVASFEHVHDAGLHLVVVRRDLTLFQHLHPKLQDDGRWSLDLTLEQAGFFRAFADFSVKGNALTLGMDLVAEGELRLSDAHAPSAIARADGYEVTLEPHSFRVGQPTALAFAVRREDRRVEDLEPYLGAMGHLVALRRGDLAYLHVHPMANDRPGMIEFHTEFPTAGQYRMFLQFAHAGAVKTVAFDTHVEYPMQRTHGGPDV